MSTRTTDHDRGHRRRRQDDARPSLVAALHERAASRSRLLREPGGVQAAERIRELVKDPAMRIGARAEALLYAAARAQLVEEALAPLLARRRLGAARPVRRLLARLPGRRAAGSGIEPVRRDQRVRHRRPAARPHAAAGDRSRPRPRALPRARRSRSTASSASTTAFFDRIAAAYEELAAAEPVRIRVIDASLSARRGPAGVTRAARGPARGRSGRSGLSAVAAAAGPARTPRRRRPSRSAPACAASQPSSERIRSLAATSIGGSPGRRGASRVGIAAPVTSLGGRDHLAHREAVAVAEVEDPVLAADARRRARAGARRRGPRCGCSRGSRSRPGSGSRCRRSRTNSPEPQRRAQDVGDQVGLGLVVLAQTRRSRRRR